MAKTKPKSMRQLAKEIGISHTYLSLILAGKRRATPEVVTKLVTSGHETSGMVAQVAEQQGLSPRLSHARRSGGEPPRNRTSNLLIKSQLLCQLS